MKIAATLVMTCLVLAAGCGGGAGEAVPSPSIEAGSFTAELDGFRIHYEVHGSGPVLMTLPNSWGLSLQGLRGLFRPLESRFTLVYFDPRGLGGSDPIQQDADMSAAAVRADFDALRRHLGLQKVNAIGWSNGAMNLLLLATERPEIFSSAIFVHGAASFLPDDSQAIRQRNPELVGHLGRFAQEVLASQAPDDVKNAGVKAFNLELWFPHMAASGAAAAPRLAEVFRDAGFSWRHVVYSQTDWPTFDVRDRLGAIDFPCLVIAGAHDMLPPTKAWEIHEGIKGSEFVIFDESGHFAPVEETQKFVDVVAAFLD